MEDLLIYNAKIYSLEKEGENFSAMTIKNGRITELYPDNPPLDCIRKMSRNSIDAENQTILPGLIDSHMHFVMTVAMSVLSTPISVYQDGEFSPKNLAEVKEIIKTNSQVSSKSTPLIFNNYVIPTIEENRLPTRMELDQWAPNRLITIIAIDGHSFSLSSEGLRKLGINPENHDGILNEDMEEFNMDKLVNLFTSTLNIKLLVEGIQKTINSAIDKGLVGLHCLEGFQDDPSADLSLKVMKLVGRKIPLKLRLYPQVKHVSKLNPYFKKMRSRRIGGCGAWDMDGAVGAKTAAFEKPYLGGSDNYGSLLLTKDEIFPLMYAAQSSGTQITTHAIGTTAINELLEAHTLLKTEFGIDTKNLRHRIDHFEFPTKEAIDRAITDLDLLIVPQPGFNWVDANYPGMNTYNKFLDPEIVQRQNPMKTIIGKGGIICGSSDSPVQSLDPWLQIHGMVNFPIESERISIYEALRTYTYNGAYATFEENDRGTIKSGKYADFIMLSQDPFDTNPENLLYIKVNKTFINGIELKKTNLAPIPYLVKLLFSKTNLI
ncbi:MAG: hypothetical protein EU530_00600 [Promethearchaeota archaeon]|nr:MAG: hypothetical protein EU530_00600 [Candidatus Lokiarchaeota archaeon]